MITVSYACKFCGKHGGVDADIPEDMPVQVEHWASMMACNRCADYFSAANRLKELVARQCYAWFIVLNGNNRKEGSDVVIRARLVRSTKLFAELTCHFLRKVNQWEPFIVDELMSNPGKSYTILANYYNRVKNA